MGLTSAWWPVLSWVDGNQRGPPPLPKGHGVSMAYTCLSDVVRSVPLVVDTQPQQEAEGQGALSGHTVRAQRLRSSCRAVESVLSTARPHGSNTG